MYCRKCGNELSENDIFCNICGTKNEVDKIDEKKEVDEYTHAKKEKKSVIIKRKIEAVIFADVVLCALLAGIWIFLTDEHTLPYPLMIGVVIISLFAFLVNSNDVYKGKCPYCKSQVASDSDAFDCPMCKRRIIRKDDKFYRV